MCPCRTIQFPMFVKVFGMVFEIQIGIPRHHQGSLYQRDGQSKPVEVRFVHFPFGHRCEVGEIEPRVRKTTCPKIKSTRGLEINTWSLNSRALQLTKSRGSEAAFELLAKRRTEMADLIFWTDVEGGSDLVILSTYLVEFGKKIHQV